MVQRGQRGAQQDQARPEGSGKRHGEGLVGTYSKIKKRRQRGQKDEARPEEVVREARHVQGEKEYQRVLQKRGFGYLLDVFVQIFGFVGDMTFRSGC